MDTSKLPQSVIDKWSEPMLTEGFVPFPKKLVRVLGQVFPGSEPVQELAALLAVVDFRRPNLTRAPSTAYLSFLAGLNEEDFRAALRRLEEKGLASVGGSPEGLEVSLEGLLHAVNKGTVE